MNAKTTTPITIQTPQPKPTHVPDDFAVARSIANKLRKLEQRIQRQIQAGNDAKLELLNCASPTVRAMVEAALQKEATAAECEVVDMGEETESAS